MGLASQEKRAITAFGLGFVNDNFPKTLVDNFASTRYNSARSVPAASVKYNNFIIFHKVK
jgi:hypothetical protein